MVHRRLTAAGLTRMGVVRRALAWAPAWHRYSIFTLPTVIAPAGPILYRADYSLQRAAAGRDLPNGLEGDHDSRQPRPRSGRPAMGNVERRPGGGGIAADRHREGTKGRAQAVTGAAQGAGTSSSGATLGHGRLDRLTASAQYNKMSAQYNLNRRAGAGEPPLRVHPTGRQEPVGCGLRPWRRPRSSKIFLGLCTADR